jgi:hypothetical protein
MLYWGHLAWAGFELKTLVVIGTDWKSNYHIYDHDHDGPYLLYYIVSHISTIMTFDWLVEGSSWPWSYGNWIYNYLCSHCLSPLMLWARISIKARCTTLCDKVCQWLAKGHWFSPGPPVSSINKTDRHDITEILLKVVLNTITQTDWLVDWISRISFAVIQVHNDVCFVSRLYIEVGKQYSPT